MKHKVIEALFIVVAIFTVTAFLYQCVAHDHWMAKCLAMHDVDSCEYLAQIEHKGILPW